MRRTLGATLMLLAAWPAPPALADPIVVDQSNLLTSGGFGGAAISPAQGFGQTFTVGVTGILRGIDLQLHQGPGTLGDVRLDLLPTLASGEPAGLDRSLFATVIPVDQIFTLRSPSDDVPVLSVPILSDAVSVQTGQTLAISLRRFEGSSAPPDWVIWSLTGSDSDYSGGSGYFLNALGWASAGPRLDATFRTHVETPAPIPEPGTLLLTATAAVGLLRYRRRWKMSRFAIFNIVVAFTAATALFSAGVNTAAADPIVIPGVATEDEGSSNNNNPFNLEPSFTFAYQQIYGALEFGLLPLRITGMAFRPDAEFGNAFSAILPSVSIFLSTTSAAVDELSPFLVDNPGPDSSLVRRGPLPLSSNFIGPSEGPKAFDILIPFSTPFFYNPTRGNLLVHVITEGGATTVVFDAVSEPGDAVARVFSGRSGPFGVPDTLGLVTQFEASPVPEPASLTLLGIGLTALGARRCQRVLVERASRRATIAGKRRAG